MNEEGEWIQPNSSFSSSHKRKNFAQKAEKVAFNSKRKNIIEKQLNVDFIKSSTVSL